MDTNAILHVWEKILQHAQEAANPPMNDPGYARWISQAVPQGMDENTFTIDVDKEFVKNWIENRYAEDITQTISIFCNRPMRLIITCSQVKEAQNPTQQPLYEQPYEMPVPVVKKEKKEEPFRNNLNEKYVFENFVIGNSNRFAHAAALAVAESPGQVYNPLFLYSDVGLGKTHLMHAIGNRIKQNHPEKKILYISSETFTNEMVDALRRNKDMESFRNKYRHIDVLLIDDIQFLRKKEASQEEFFHTFNTLKDANKQIIISSDRKPKELDTLEERLRSRFEWGLNADIQQPDVETRMAILRNRAEQDKINLTDDVVLFIASNVDTNIRELEGAYTKVVAYTNINNLTINLDNTKKALSEINSSTFKKQITIQEIQQKVANQYKIRMDDFLVKKRTRNVAFPRQIAMYLCRELTDYSLPKIGEFFGGRDHTTVIHACEKIAKEMKKDPYLEKNVNEMKLQLRK